MCYTKNMRNVKEKLLQFMERENLTICELAELTDVSEETIKYILYKHPHNCKMSTLIQLSQGMGISIDELTGIK